MNPRNALRELAEAVPVQRSWRWGGVSNRPETSGTYGHDIRLMGRKPEGDRIGGEWVVMDFTRHGFRGAQPRFLGPDEFSLVKAADVVEHEHTYRDDVSGLDNPTARYLAAVDPETILGLLDRIAELETAINDHRRAEVAEQAAGDPQDVEYAPWDVALWDVTESARAAEEKLS